MKQLVQDKNKKLCAAKTAFMISLVVCLYKIITGDTPDYNGMAVFLTPLGAVYWGRSYSKIGTDNAKFD